MGLRSLDQQLRRIEALDSKAGILIAADGVLAGLLFGRASLLLRAPRGVTVAASIALIASLVAALVAFASRGYYPAPEAEVVAGFASASEGTLRWRSLDAVLHAIARNRRDLQWKARVLSLALALLIVAVGVLGGYFVYVTSTPGTL